MIKECEEADIYAKQANEEVSLIDPKTDKKAYKATFKLGLKTDTGDLEGNVIEEKEFDINA